MMIRIYIKREFRTCRYQKTLSRKLSILALVVLLLLFNSSQSNESEEGYDEDEDQNEI